MSISFLCMYLAVITRITVWLLRFRNVKPRKICRPPGLQPIARKRCSCAECKSSSRTEMLSDEKSASISSMETPWFWHFAELPSSQSKPEMSSNMVWSSICTVICQYKYAPFQSNPFLNHRGRDFPLPTLRDIFSRKGRGFLVTDATLSQQTGRLRLIFFRYHHVASVQIVSECASSQFRQHLCRR